MRSGMMSWEQHRHKVLPVQIQEQVHQEQAHHISLAEQTAEMPGFYQGGEYDVAGFAVGAVKQEAVIDGSRIQEGDALIGFASSGVHSNGFSLVRKILEVGCQPSSSLPALQPFKDYDALHASKVLGTRLRWAQSRCDLPCCQHCSSSGNVMLCMLHRCPGPAWRMRCPGAPAPLATPCWRPRRSM